ncbi:MAG: magnesium transporter CorA family protein [Thermoleophilia bacterium]
MAHHLIDAHGLAEVAVDRRLVDALRARTDFAWLDLRAPTDDELGLVGEALGFHPLALEDSRSFGQRPKLDPYGDVSFLVVYGANNDEDGLVEVHCFYSERRLVTVRRDACPAFAELRERHVRRPLCEDGPAHTLHQVVDALVDSFFPVLANMDDLIDAIEEAIAERPDQEQLRRIFLLKRRLIALRRVVAPQRDLVATIANGVADLPGTGEEADRRFRDVYDHLIRLVETLDSYRDLLSGITDVYLSTVSNRLSDITKRLAAVATIFLPLTFITGFFGQNFTWMVDHVGGLAAFLGLGIGLQLLVFAVFVVLFRRRGWF